MRWIKKFDQIADLVPSRLVALGVPRASLATPVIIRPGGLGDMVVLTRAMRQLNLELSRFVWICEKRNALWLDYLGVSYRLYDDLSSFFRLLFIEPRHLIVVNTEQIHGLSSLFARRLAGKRGILFGFDSVSRADVFNQRVHYEGSHEPEIEAFGRLLVAALGAPSSNNAITSVPELGPPRFPEPYLVVALAGFQDKVKRLSLDEWRLVIRTAGRASAKLILIGAPADREIGNELEGSLEIGITNLVGSLDFSEVVSIVRSAKRLVSIDSGLVHVADFFSIPSDVIFRNGFKHKWGPQTKGSRVFDSVVDFQLVSYNV